MSASTNMVTAWGWTRLSNVCMTSSFTCTNFVATTVVTLSSSVLWFGRWPRSLWRGRAPKRRALRISHLHHFPIDFQDDALPPHNLYHQLQLAFAHGVIIF